MIHLWTFMDDWTTALDCVLQLATYNLSNMSAIKLELIHAFGSTCSQRYKNCIAICDEEKNEAKIVFPAGKCLAKKSIDRPEMEFVPFHQSTEHIENICILPTRAHVAVAYQPADALAQTIRIYSFRPEEDPITLKIFHENEKAGQIKLLYFSPSEPKFMCALLGQPHGKLLFVDTFKNKALAESSFSAKDADQLTICPSNSHLICVSGGTALRLFKVEEYTFKPLEEVRRIPKGRRITAHAWYKKKMIVAATDKCEILILQEARPNAFEIRQEYHNVFNEVKFDRLLVTAICTFSKGFILGSNTGKFCLWTRKEDSNTDGEQALQLSRKWSTTEQRAAEVTNIEISSREDIIAISLANNDIATLYISELIPQVSDLLNDLTDKEIVFEYLYKGFHNHPVTGMDVCEQRPLVATCSQQDSTIRIWNYKNFSCKLLRMFYFKIREEFDSDRPLITLAFHPSGYYLAVGCVDKLRFFHVLNAELRPYRELGVRNAHIVKFSRGGHLMAACFPAREEASSSHVKVFNALTLEEIVVLKDHQSLIRSLEFKRYDECLLSAGEEGAIVEWRVADWSRARGVVRKEMRYTCCIYWHARNSVVAFGEFRGKKYLEELGENGSVSQLQVELSVVAMMELAVGREKGLLLSLEGGRLAVFGGLQRPTVMDLKNYHLARAGNLAVSPCGKFVMSSGEDGVVLVLRASHAVDGVAQEEEHSNIVVDDFLADVVLINRREIAKVSEREREFSKVIGNLGRKLKQLAVEGQARHGKRMLEVQLQKNRIIDDVNYRIDRLRSQVEQLRSKNSVELTHLDLSHVGRAEQLERTYEEKINFEVEKYFQLEQELIQIRIIHKKEMEQLRRLEEDEIARLKADFEGKFKDSEQIYSSSKTEAERAISIFEQRVRQVEEEQEEEIREIQLKKHKFKQETAASLQELHERQGKLKKEHGRLTDQRNDERRKNEERWHARRKLEKEVEEAAEKLKDMNAEFQEKEQILATKERRISEFEEKIADLQKKKHILSYKGTEMKKAMEPKELQIDKLRTDLIKLKKEFEGSLERKQKSVLGLQRSEKEKANLQRAVEAERRQTERASETIDQMLGDVFHCLQSFKKVGDAKVFYKQFVKLYHRYVEKDDRGEQVAESKGMEELTRQVLHLEKSLYQINKTNEKNILRKNDEIYKRIKENTELVTNLNEIKKDNKEILLKIRAKRDEIERLRALKAALLADCANIDTNTYKMFLQDDFIQTDKGFEKSRASLAPPASSLAPSASKPSLATNNPSSDKKSIHKAECELLSEIEFTNERLHKVEFFIREMKDRVRKHLAQFRCENTFTLEDEEEIRSSDA